MNIARLLEKIDTIHCLHRDIPVENTTGEYLRAAILNRAGIVYGETPEKSGPVLKLGVLSREEAAAVDHRLPGTADWLYLRAGERTGIDLYVSRTWLLYRLAARLVEDWQATDITGFANGRILQPAFPQMRTAYDTLLNNHGRTARGFDPEEHVRELARLGYTHVEVNGLADHVPYERAAPDELLYRFYTYCPALDQFVYSRLNKGIYPFELLQANLNKLKFNARLAEKYGLRAGLLSFEPRSVPDELLQRYPMLRGARVDHPLRSFRPRYNLTTAHPVVLEHYSEMLEKILRAAPNIDYMTVWSNDSGAGFEYTSSLYVGRNGGGYVIREFKTDEEVRKAAAGNIVRFLRTLRDAGRRVNPGFRAILRSDMLYDEQDDVWSQAEDGLEFEVNSLLYKGPVFGYKHPKYEWARDFNITGLFNRFADEEKPVKEQLEAKGSNAHIYFSPGMFSNQEPVIAPVFPCLLFEKLRALRQQEITRAVGVCGTVPPSMAPYNINQEVIRAFQNDPSMDLDAFLLHRAAAWAGKEEAPRIVEAWRHADEAYRSYPVTVNVLSVWSTWYRTLVRPFLPNMEALGEAERAYYEDFHLGHVNNFIRVDFRREINFVFTTPDYAGKCREAITANVFPEIRKALRLARDGRDHSEAGSPAREVWSHLYERFCGLECWFRNQRNIAAWIEGVHGYLEAGDDAAKSRCRRLVRETVLDEKENARNLLRLTETAQTGWMLVSATGETTFIYGENFGGLLKRKIALMEGREDDEPYIDPDYIWRVPGYNC